MKFTIKTVLCLCLSMMLVLPAHAQEGDKGLSKKTIDENKDFAMKQYVSTTKTNSPEQLQKDCQMSFDLWSQYVEQLENRQFSQEFCMYEYE